VDRPVLLTPDTSWGAEESLDPPPGDDVFARYPPPFDLEADMLFCLAPGPLVVWFARIARGRDGSGRVEEAPYHELNVMEPRRDGSFFVPVIWATSRRSVRIGWRYGMPKAPTTMSFRERNGTVESRAEGSFVRARVLPGGRTLGMLAAALLPAWSPLVRFPNGSTVRGQVRAAPRLHAALVVGRLAAGRRLLPVGLYAPGLVMRLPPP
jgi:hypothetical protein